jgi:hypothetical protein
VTKGKSGAERLKKYYAVPANREARAKRQREHMAANRDELSRKAKAALRGCDVPSELESAWTELKRKKLSSREAARALGLPYRAPRKRKPAGKAKPTKKGAANG